MAKPTQTYEPTSLTGGDPGKRLLLRPRYAMSSPSRWTTMWAAAASALAIGCSRDPPAADPAARAPARVPRPPLDFDRETSAPRHQGKSTQPEGYLTVTVAGVTPTPHGSAVLLLDQESQRVVPVFVGSTEALAIELRLEHRRYGRPLTHDLFDSMLLELGGAIDSVRVDKLAGGVFYATVLLNHEGKTHELDSRSSDAVAIALGHGTPIFMARSVLSEAGVSLDSIEIAPKADAGTGEPGDLERRNGTVTL